MLFPYFSTWYYLCTNLLTKRKPVLNEKENNGTPTNHNLNLEYIYTSYETFFKRLHKRGWFLILCVFFCEYANVGVIIRRFVTRLTDCSKYWYNSNGRMFLSWPTAEWWWKWQNLKSNLLFFFNNFILFSKPPIGSFTLHVSCIGGFRRYWVRILVKQNIISDHLSNNNLKFAEVDNLTVAWFICFYYITLGFQ